jgi:hypothetical protein
VQLRLQKGGGTDVVNPPEVRVRVVAGTIIPYQFNSESQEWVQVTDWTALPKNVHRDFQEGHRIQFNRLGRFFKMGAIGDEFQLLKDDGDTLLLTLPEDDPEIEMGTDAMEYRVSKSSGGGISLAWLPPVVMPFGTIVDLAFSGGETVDFDGNSKSGNDIPPQFLQGNEVVVVFSPAGHVDVLSINGEEMKVNEMLYFCVGDWDRRVDTGGHSLAEDGKSNLETPATYWVTLHPKTGGVRIAENAPIRSDKQLRDARKFASEHFFDIGGQ